ncbi:hypothetical protein [Alkalicoccus chagannorensis]|uniref:hypothetical protein n=1 Tax=Alkalicoccus chagannorensis TaxID=427072 RepID=UPI0004100F1D|nr:hypothetical protein [Alkalicoccus chagannorensis]
MDEVELKKRTASLAPEDQEKVRELTEQMMTEQKKLEVEVPAEPEDRLAVQQTIERLEAERERLLGPL